MKKVLLISLMIIPVFLSSCILDMKPVITGNRDVVTETREVKNFEHLKVSTGLKVYITFGVELSLKVEADKNLHEIIKTEVDNGRLKVFTEENIRKAKAKNIYITVPELRSIGVSSAGTVLSKNILKTDEIEIKVSSAGKLELQVEAKNLDVEVSSSGKVILSGKVEDLDVNVSSAGKLEAFDLISQSCKVNASSAGHVSVNVEQKLNAQASSAGSITYKGDPTNKNVEKSSAGSVVQK